TRTRLLIIHPEPTARSMLASMLSALGYEPVVTNSDLTSLQLLTSLPALVLIGVDMTAPDALEFFACIRRSYPRVPIILLSTRTNPERNSQALRLGATSVLKFPLPTSQLQSAVVQALDESLAEKAT